MKLRILTIGAAAALSTLAACSPRDGVDDAAPAWAQGPTIEALGRAFVEVPPNRARFSVTFEEKAVDSADASRVVIEQARAASDAIRQVSDNQVRLTANLDVRPYYEQERIKQDEFREQIIENVHPDHRLGFVARVTINVVVLDADAADAARSAALAASPVASGAIRFYLEPTAEDQRAAFAAAVNDAHERARAAASASGARLGRLLVLQEGRGPCLSQPSTPTGRDEYTRGYAAAPVAMAMASEDSIAAERPRTSAEIIAQAEDFELAADPDPSRVEARACAVYRVR